MCTNISFSLAHFLPRFLGPLLFALSSEFYCAALHTALHSGNIEKPFGSWKWTGGRMDTGERWWTKKRKIIIIITMLTIRRNHVIYYAIIIFWLCVRLRIGQVRMTDKNENMNKTFVKKPNGVWCPSNRTILWLTACGADVSILEALIAVWLFTADSDSGRNITICFQILR